MDRRRFLTKSLLAGGAVASMGNIVRPGLARAVTGAPSSPRTALPSEIPWSYSAKDLEQDATHGLPVPNGVEVGQGSKYRIKLCWVPMNGPGSGWLEFRKIDAKNYYMLKFNPTAVSLAEIVNATAVAVAGAARIIDTDHPAMFTLHMNGTHFTVTDDSATGAPVILDWKDPQNLFPAGHSVVHYTAAGTFGCWQDVVGTKLSDT